MHPENAKVEFDSGDKKVAADDVAWSISSGAKVLVHRELQALKGSFPEYQEALLRTGTNNYFENYDNG